MWALGAQRKRALEVGRVTSPGSYRALSMKPQGRRTGKGTGLPSHCIASHLFIEKDQNLRNNLSSRLPRALPTPPPQRLLEPLAFQQPATKRPRHRPVPASSWPEWRGAIAKGSVLRRRAAGAGDGRRSKYWERNEDKRGWESQQPRRWPEKEEEEEVDKEEKEEAAASVAAAEDAPARGRAGRAGRGLTCAPWPGDARAPGCIRASGCILTAIIPIPT